MTRKEAIKILKDSMAGRMVLYKDSIQATQIAIAALEKFPHWISAKEERPKHLQRCLCHNKYMVGVYCYVYDDISKYWCTQTTEEHDPNGDNHVVDYADYDVTHWMTLPEAPHHFADVSQKVKKGDEE